MQFQHRLVAEGIRDRCDLVDVAQRRLVVLHLLDVACKRLHRAPGQHRGHLLLGQRVALDGRSIACTVSASTCARISCAAPSRQAHRLQIAQDAPDLLDGREHGGGDGEEGCDTWRLR